MPTNSPSRYQQSKAVATGFASGFFMPARAGRLLTSRPGLKRWAVLPLIANFIIYSLLVALAVYLIGVWDPQVPAWDFWGGFGTWLSKALNWVIGPLKWIVLLPATMLFCYFTFTTVGMLVATPFNDILSEKTENALCHPRDASSMSLRLEGKAMMLSLHDALMILLRQVFWTVLVLPLLLIPVVGMVPLFTVTAWFSGLGFVDTAMGRNYLRNRHKATLLKQRRWQIFGLGLAMELLFLVPFVGLLMLPLGVVAGTIIYCTGDWKRLLSEAGLDEPEGFVVPCVVTAEDAGQD